MLTTFLIFPSGGLLERAVNTTTNKINEPGFAAAPGHRNGFTGTLVSLPEAKLARARFLALPGLKINRCSFQHHSRCSECAPEYGRVQFPIDQWLEDQPVLAFYSCSGAVKLTTAS